MTNLITIKNLIDYPQVQIFFFLLKNRSLEENSSKKNISKIFNYQNNAFLVEERNTNYIK